MNLAKLIASEYDRFLCKIQTIYFIVPVGVLIWASVFQSPLRTMELIFFAFFGITSLFSISNGFKI